MKNRWLWMAVVIALLVLLNACVVVDFGKYVQTGFRGDYLLYNQKYAEGIVEFENKVAQDNGNATSYYYLGRFLLVQKKPEPLSALENFEHAVRLSPGNNKYLFWQGVALGVLHRAPEERQVYEQILSKNKYHLQALTYLGHNHLEAGDLEGALKLYEKVLKLWPYSPSALFNKGLIMRKSGRVVAEKKAWLEYLDVYPSGAMTRRAVVYLNSLGDFQYRNQRIGARMVTTEKFYFQSSTDKLKSKSLPSLNLVGSVFAKMVKTELYVVVFKQGDTELAKKRAKIIKKYLLDQNPQIAPSSIMISWFAVGEEVKVLGGKIIRVNESVTFFTNFTKRM